MNLNKRITVFTPTYNRVNTLPRLYNSLIKQTSDNFCWLIIDDGSTDKTKELVNTWISENKIQINYIFQKNKGMVGAHNTAHHNMDTELCVCIDSDDYMPNKAIERIICLWEKYGYPESAGMVGLDAFEDGSIIGTNLPTNIRECTFSELNTKYKIDGDKKFIHNRNIFNQYLPYPFFKNEKFPVTSYLYLKIEKKHKLLIFNEVFCIVEYQLDGLSMNLFKQYIDSPKSFAFYRIQKMRSALNFRERFKNTIHFISSSIMAKDWFFLKKSPYKILTFLMIPAGVLLYLYITKSNKKSIIKLN
jgi:glycosyltransferase involved in cell wall biosynthesis